eukprot:8169445-Pyramimonas_sp.AAC.1
MAGSVTKANPPALTTDDGRRRMSALIQWKPLFKELSKLFATNENVRRCGRDIATKMEGVSERSNFLELTSSIDKWVPGDAGPVHSVMASVKANQSKEFPGDVTDKCLVLFRRGS